MKEQEKTISTTIVYQSNDFEIAFEFERDWWVKWTQRKVSYGLRQKWEINHIYEMKIQKKFDSLWEARQYVQRFVSKNFYLQEFEWNED